MRNPPKARVSYDPADLPVAIFIEEHMAPATFLAYLDRYGRYDMSDDSFEMEWLGEYDDDTLQARVVQGYWRNRKPTKTEAESSELEYYFEPTFGFDPRGHRVTWIDLDF